MLQNINFRIAVIIFLIVAAAVILLINIFLKESMFGLFHYPYEIIMSLAMLFSAGFLAFKSKIRREDILCESEESSLKQVLRNSFFFWLLILTIIGLVVLSIFGNSTIPDLFSTAFPFWFNAIIAITGAIVLHYKSSSWLVVSYLAAAAGFLLIIKFIKNFDWNIETFSLLIACGVFIMIALIPLLRATEVPKEK